MDPTFRNSLAAVEPWDPLFEDSGNLAWLADSQKLVIKNILGSYTGFYDVFSELIQNALDAMERREEEETNSYQAKLWIKIDIGNGMISVTDNGCAMSLDQFRAFLRPNLTFKDKRKTRGHKGVGISYLAYGFNHLEVATRRDHKTYSGVFKNGRRWIGSDTESAPKIEPSDASHSIFYSVDRGTSFTLRLLGENIRPKNLAHFGARTSKQWLTILRAKTPLGRIYLAEDKPVMDFQLTLEVIDSNGETTREIVDNPNYLYPNEIFDKVIDVEEYLEWSRQTADEGRDNSRPPLRFQKLNGITGIWRHDNLLQPGSVFHGMELEESDEELLKELRLQIYVFLGYSTDLWDDFNDRRQQLRQGSRIIEGGLQLATKHMPQGKLLTIPLKRNIGYQHNSHVIVHIDANPDLGRKGFQPEHESLAEKLAVRAIGQFSNRFSRLLRGKTGEPTFHAQMRLDQWKEEQKTHARNSPLVVQGKGLFLPTEQLPILSTPRVEQDVVALFNQMLSSGLVRGIRLLSSSQYNQYDGLFKVVLDTNKDKYAISDENPLGVEIEQLDVIQDVTEGPAEILEYKYNMNGLFEEFDTGEKRPDDISLVVAWQLGSKWQENFQVVSFLNPYTRHHRPFHGFTHMISHSVSRLHAFHAIVLEDLINYLRDRECEESRQISLYSEQNL